jgi:hypothetical protein
MQFFSEPEKNAVYIIIPFCNSYDRLEALMLATDLQ